MDDHLIKKVELRLDFGGKKKDAVAAANQLFQQLSGETWAELDRTFNRICPPKFELEIDTLEIDLGELNNESLLNDLGSRLSDALATKLGKMKLPDAWPVDLSQISASGAEEASVDPKQLFFRFLSTGKLDWFYYRNGWPQWEENLLTKLDHPSFYRELLWLLIRKPAAIDRLQWQHSADFRARLVMGILPAFTSLVTLKPKKENRIEEEITLGKLRDFLSTSGQESIRLSLDKPQEIRGEFLKSKLEIPATVFEPAAELAENVQQTEAEEMYLEYAGLAIIIPCYHLILAELGWVTENNFISEIARVKAVYLLRWIATETTAAKEADLLLEKLVCGFPEELPLPPPPGITDTELELTASCVEQLLAQWTMGTGGNPVCPSLAGLRAHYLSRKGLIKPGADSSTLWVEEGSMDKILLKSLPWTYSMVRLAWMDRLLKVKWG